jgi:hypothetical protein
VRFSILFVTLLVGCTPTSSLERSITRLSTDASFGNEEQVPILLPATVMPVKVVARAIAARYGVKDLLYKILAVREDWKIKGRVYTAALIATNTGREIVLVRYDEQAGGWWWNVYHVSDRKS